MIPPECHKHYRLPAPGRMLITPLLAGHDTAMTPITIALIY